MAASWGWDC